MLNLAAIITKIRPYLIILSCISVITGIYISPTLLTIGMLLLVVFFLLNPKIKHDLKFLLQDKSVIVLSLIFFVYAISGLYSTNTDYLLERLRIKLPFLFMPLGFISLKSLRTRHFYFVLYFFILTVFSSSVGVLTNYLIHFHEISTSISLGKSIPSPINHIRYSLMVVIAISSCGYLLGKNYFLLHKKEKYFQWVILIFFVIFLHIFSVRSGLVALYLVMIYLTTRYIYLHKRYLAGSVAVILIFATPFFAYKHIPSFTNKVNYMHYDLKMFLSGNSHDELSDSKRLISMKAGLDVGNQHFFLGTGVGDVNDVVNGYYKSHFPFIDTNVIIHNQYLYFYAATGIVGLVLIIIILLFPVFYNGNYTNWYFVSLNIILLFSFLVEATLETQVGTAIYLFFISLAIAGISTERKDLVRSP